MRRPCRVEDVGSFDQRRAVLTGRLLAVHGTIEREGEVVHLVASRFTDHSRLLGALETRSRDFH